MDDDIARMDWESNYMAEEVARDDKLAPAASGRNAPVAAAGDALKQPAGTGKPQPSSASRDDLDKDDQRANVAAAEKEAAAVAPRKTTATDDGTRSAEQPPEDTTGADTSLMSDEKRAQLDKRLQMAEDGSRIEQRPLTHPGLKSAQPDHTEYAVERELREQWPLAYRDEEDA